MKKNKFKDRTYNVLFVTLDSCRYDTALEANPKYLNSVAKLRNSLAHGDYTFPSHHSLFLGNLPTLIDAPPYYLDNYYNIWRSTQAKKTSNKIAISFEGSNIIEFYDKIGYQVIGCGGVSFFKRSNFNSLPKLFPTFLHFQKETDLTKKMPREISEFPLANIDNIINSFRTDEAFFLFINCPETHIPYDNPATNVTDFFIETVNKIYSLEKEKHNVIPTNKVLSSKEYRLLQKAQKDSLLWVDEQLHRLVVQLREINSLPILLVVCGDHGEEWGEGGRYGHAHYHEKVINVPLWINMI